MLLALWQARLLISHVWEAPLLTLHVIHWIIPHSAESTSACSAWFKHDQQQPFFQRHLEQPSGRKRF